MTRIALHHRTVYHFDREVRLSPHLIRLRPAAHNRTPIESYSLNVGPAEQLTHWQEDPFGNRVARVIFQEPANELSVAVELIANLVPRNPFNFLVDLEAQTYPFKYEEPTLTHLQPYLEKEDEPKAFNDWVKKWKGHKGDTVTMLVELNQQVAERIEYQVRLEQGTQSCAVTLETGIGSCRDSAWLLIQLARHLGFAARFVSGYLIQLKTETPEGDGPKEDFTDLHAWAEIYLPGAGWVGFDATSGYLTAEQHIPLCCTPNPAGASPIEGTTEPCETTMTFENSFRRLDETKASTDTYDKGTWAEILKLGDLVDEKLKAGDVRLTMGGEPTFISEDDRESFEWRTTADGWNKRLKGIQMAERLRDRFGPGGLLYYGTGKWYPGEGEPRWQIGIIWRKDGKPLLPDASRWADAFQPGEATPADMQALGERIAKKLGFEKKYLHTAYEDPLFWLTLERKLQPDVRVSELLEDTDLWRKRLGELLTAGLDSPVGVVLPLEFDEEEKKWITSEWRLRSGQIILEKGTLPINERLPLTELDPETEPLDTAFCLECKRGVIYAVMPKVPSLKVYMELLKVVDESLKELGLKAVLSGALPPSGEEAIRLTVTPDPGVLEINLHPASSWRELVEIHEVLHEEAKKAGLTAEKYLVNGRKTGSGGGHHITLGGPSKADSPLLRKPALLGRMVTFWQHHPALSYLFSGTFIGATSQSPRMDEGRREQLYELEIALAHLPDKVDSVPLWYVDDLMRHLLTDITGNNHRAEFCIDKLHHPDAPQGKLGLLELRAFEMPPNAQMSLLQVLLVRSLVAMLWDKPMPPRLVRWGTALHDRFMLPHFLAEDIAAVADELQENGFPMRAAWFDAFVNFRFPILGQVTVQGVDLELRLALEPWYVLGEQMGERGTSRFVDSSVERIQVRLRRLDPSRYWLLCNGHIVPLTPTETADEFVAGVRFKAWNPSYSLHPNIPAHAPLSFDLYDRWNRCSVGGCTYHTIDPTGIAWHTQPRNARDAEARREALFEPVGHLQGTFEVPPGPLNLYREVLSRPASDQQPNLPPDGSREYPMTLDLRTVRLP